ncbi:thioredoxin-like protein, partial [Pseudoneurospora amorphoporcata]
MPVELRKRKAPPPPPAPVKKQATKATKAAAKAKAQVENAASKAAEIASNAAEVTTETATAAAQAAAEAVANGAAKAATALAGNPKVGDLIDLDNFGGEVETNDGTKTSLKKLVEESKAGVVLFTYPKASTPGCTRQVCLFRDSYTALSSATGLSIYGLSSDSPKANTTFKEKQKLPYPLLCDPSYALIGAIGLKKAPKGTTRGVFVVDKSGKVLAAEPGGPEATVKVVQRVVSEMGEEGKIGKEEAEEVVKEEGEK